MWNGRRTKLRNGKEMKTLRAHGFNQRPRFEQVVGYLERNEPLLDQPDRKATSFVTSHFYLDDFVQSSEDPNPRPLQHTSLHPEDGFRTPAEVTDEDVRLARRYFVEDDLAGDPEAGALAALHHGPPAQHCRRRAGGSGPHRSRGRRARSRAGLPLSAAPGRRRVRPPKCVAPSGPGAAASADHRPAQ